MAESLLTPERAAQLLAVRPKTIREWLKRGRLNPVSRGPALENTGMRPRGFSCSRERNPVMA